MTEPMTLEDVAARLEDLAVENDLPELQGLANALGKFSRTENRCEFCQKREREQSIPHRIVEMMIHMGVIAPEDLERYLYREMLRHGVLNPPRPEDIFKAINQV